jgi:hypothetical protein
MFGLIFLGIAVLLAAVHVALSKDRSPRNVARVLLLYLLPIAVGLGGVMAFLGHTLRADEIARSIGWEPGSPFQFEVAVANLAFGILGLFCIKFRDGFWMATILGYGVFLEGAAYGHLREIVRADNWATNNAGVILGIDVLFPLCLLGLLALASSGWRSADGATA